MSSSSSFADQDCGAEVHLDDVGGSMENVLPLDQKSMPICYAFSAAELLQTWRCSHGAPDCSSKMVSPVAVAVSAELWEINHGTAKSSGQPEAFWGYSRKQIQAAELFRGPYCDQGSIGSLNQESALNTYINELFALYKKRCIQAVSVFQSSGSPDPASIDQASCRLLDGQPLTHQSFEQLALDTQKCFEENGFPIELKQVETSLVSFNPLLLVEGEIQDSCRNNPVDVPSMPPMDFYSIKPQDGNEPDVDRMAKAKQAIAAEFDKLGKKAQPVFISYCADVVPEGRNFIPAYGADCSGHASLIIGRRKDPKTHACQYLIRNSWGKTCNRDTHKSHFSYHPDWECVQEKGDYWIDQDTLLRATLEIGGVENEGIGGLIPASYMSSRTAPAN